MGDDLDTFSGALSQLSSAFIDKGEAGAYMDFGKLTLVREEGPYPYYAVFFEGEQIDAINVRRFSTLSKLHRWLKECEERAKKGEIPAWDLDDAEPDGSVHTPKGVE